MDDDEDERDYDLADLREEDVLEQLQELHRQLAEKRSDDDGGRAPAEKRSGPARGNQTSRCIFFVRSVGRACS